MPRSVRTIRTSFSSSREEEKGLSGVDGLESESESESLSSGEEGEVAAGGLFDCCFGGWRDFISSSSEESGWSVTS